jgi:hypothetical protein
MVKRIENKNSLNNSTLVNDPFYGEIKCQTSLCTNNAYWKCKGRFLCGVHSRTISRTLLKKMSIKEKQKKNEKDFEVEKEEILKAQNENKTNKRKGNVILSKLKMMKKVENLKGYLKVFPNFKHQNRKDGYGCKSLSPMSLGPVKHGQPGLPDSKNIENFHQGSKCFTEEADKNKNPTKTFYKNQLKFFNDEIAHRHKFKGKNKQNINVPLFWVWRDKDGKEHKLSYIQSRQFYCNFYERLAKEEHDFKLLKQKLRDGINLQIVGYDANPVRKGIMDSYLDPSKPFGHENVLYTMLTEEEPEKYPWRVHKTFDF